MNYLNGILCALSALSGSFAAAAVPKPNFIVMRIDSLKTIVEPLSAFGKA